MSVFEGLHPASFRGFGFLVRTETKEGGKKTVTHEYVGSDKRFTEELGKLPPKITLEAVIHGDDAIIQRQVFEQLLDEPGVAELVHPVYGSIQVKTTTYSASSNQTEIGEFRYSINFETSERNITAEPVRTTAPTASNLADTCRGSIDTVLEDEFVGPLKPNILDRTATKGTSIFDQVFKEVSSATNAVQSKVSEFTRVVNDGKSKINTIVQQGTTMKQALVDLYTSGLNVVNTPADLLDSWKTLLDFGFADEFFSLFGTGSDTTSTETSFSVDTVLRTNEDKSKVILNEHTRLTALINLYEAAAHKTYETDAEIDDIRKTLNESFNNQLVLKIIDSSNNTLSDAQLALITPIVDDLDVRKNILNLRSTVNDILDQKEQNVWKVQEISPGLSSMLLTTFRYYGSTDNLSLLTGLNPSVNSANFDQTIQAVSN